MLAVTEEMRDPIIAPEICS